MSTKKVLAHSEFIPAVKNIVDLYEESVASLDVSKWAASRKGPFVVIGSAVEAEGILGGHHPPRSVAVHPTGANGDHIGIIPSR